MGRKILRDYPVEEDITVKTELRLAKHFSVLKILIHFGDFVGNTFNNRFVPEVKKMEICNIYKYVILCTKMECRRSKDKWSHSNREKRE